MKKLTLLTILIISFIGTVFGDLPEKMITFSYKKPYEYQLINGHYMVNAIIKASSWVEGDVVRYNDEELQVKKIGNGDIQIALPLIGNPDF